MKHFLVVNGFEFYMTDGVKQEDNVDKLFHRMDKKNVRSILTNASKIRVTMKAALGTNPVLSKLLGKILLGASKKLQ